MRSLEKKLVPLAVLALATVLAPALAIAQSTSHLVRISFEGAATTGISNSGLASATLTGKGDDFGKGTLTFSGLNGTPLGSSGSTTLGTCSLEGDGASLMKTSDGGSSITMQHRGVSCTVGTGFGEVIINAVYTVTSGTGRYANTTGGTGNLVVHIINGVAAQGHLDGNVIVTIENDD